jgi:lactoylglutathione lyase
MNDKTPARPYPLDYKSWVYGLGNNKPRFLHTMFCVTDLEASRRFYVDALGMTLFDRMDFDFAPRVSALFVGYDINEGVMELSHYWDGDGPYARRTGFGHVAFGVPDLNGILSRLKSLGIHIRKEPVVVIEGAPAAAFLDDPDGYEVELIQSRNA